MLTIYRTDVDLAGFESFRLCSTQSEFQEQKLESRIDKLSLSSNGRSLGKNIIRYYPADNLVEIPVMGECISRAQLDRAIVAAEAASIAAGFAVQGRRLYRLIVMRSDNHRVWARVGNQWSEPRGGK